MTPPSKEATQRASARSPLSKKKKQTKEGDKSFEFCEVCNLNHSQGRRHKYFPAHCCALADSMSRFEKKLSELQFFIPNPSRLRPEHASFNSIWCVFCALDISEIGSFFVCGNAIRHLASNEHFRNLKKFLWKHGKGKEHVDLFRVSDVELVEWEKGCEELKNGASSSTETLAGPVLYPSKDIQLYHEPNSIKMDCFDNHSISYFCSRPVFPLQRFTNENYLGCLPNGDGSVGAAHITQNYITLPLFKPDDAPFHLFDALSAGKHLNGIQHNSMDFKRRAGHVETIVYGHGTDYKQSNEDLQLLTQIASSSESSHANVHNGGLPPWLDMCDESEKNLVKFGAHLNKHAPLDQKEKSKKLNPKRVGAAWAEKRRIELEMEKTGDIVKGSVDANWLPNFGRVWQTGTRKESRKEFEIENSKLFKDGLHSEVSFKLQPYISKRMRMESCIKVDTVVPFKEQL